MLVIWETWKGWHTGNRYPNPTPIWDPNNMLNKSLTIQKLIQIQTQIQTHRKGGTLETDMTKCHSIRHQTPKFPTPPKSYATIFLGYSGPYFGPTNTNHTKKYQKIIFGALFRIPPQNALQCTTVQCNVLKCKHLNYSLHMGQI